MRRRPIVELESLAAFRGRSTTSLGYYEILTPLVLTHPINTRCTTCQSFLLSLIIDHPHHWDTHATMLATLYNSRLGMLVADHDIFLLLLLLPPLLIDHLRGHNTDRRIALWRIGGKLR
jgi:hypothetical protein